MKCKQQVENLPRQIIKKDKKIKFGKRYSGLFKENYEKVFDYNLYLEQNLAKNSSNNQLKKGKQRLFKKYCKESQQYLRENLFENQCIIKSEKCKYLDTNNFVTIYYDQLTDLFAIVDSKKNCLLDFGIATEVNYAEIFAYNSSGTVRVPDICLSPNKRLEDDSVISRDLKSGKSKQLQVYTKQYILSSDDAIAILKARYGTLDNPNFVDIQNGEFKITEQQAAKKIEHAVCFKLNPQDFDFSQEQARQINKDGGIVAYIREGKKLPSLDFIRTYQNTLKNFCENQSNSVRRNDASTFRGEPSITFSNLATRQVVIFSREKKTFISAYKLSELSMSKYLETDNIGSTGI